MLANKQEVTILGGGAIGFSIAYHLAKEGISSQLIEMDSIGAKASGTSMGCIASPAGGIFYLGSRAKIEVLQASLALIVESSYRHQKLHLELRERTGLDVRYGEMSCLFCAFLEEEEKTVKELVSEANYRGYEATWLSADAVRAKDSLITAEVRGAAFIPYAQLDAYRYTLALAQAAEGLGSNVKLAEVTGLRRVKNRITSVILSSGEVTAGTVVIAMGPWSVRAGSWLQAGMPLKVVRGQAIKLLAPKRPKHDTYYPLPQSEWPSKNPGRLFLCNSPRVDGSVLSGYSEDRPETWDDSRPETWEDAPTQEMKEAMMAGAVRLHPSLEDAMLVEVRHGLLGYPPDEIPIIGPVPGWENVYVATGLGDLGVLLSAATGRIITDLIVGGERAKRATQEAKAFSPSRFQY